MLLKNWLAGLARKQPLSRRFTRRRQPGDVRPAVERLEDRTLLAAVFGDQVIISTTADGAVDVFAVDVDGDGDLDVLSASALGDKIAWYENDGSQNFTERIISTVADRAHDLFVADVDGDGDIDVLSASMDDDTIAWYENDGSQNFTAHPISTSADGAREVFAADVDGDGDIDVLSASFDSDTIAWYENDGSQNFTEHVVSTAADGSHAVFATDVDGDGDIDVLSASALDDKIAWYENDGSQNFTERIISTAADGARRVFAADVDGDGDIDVLSASVGDDKIAWYENDGSQNFTERTISTVANGARCVDATDLDGDGDLDILSASLDDDKIVWYENDGSQNFTERIISTAADGAVTVFAADVDGDGDLDVLSASYNDDKIAWYEHNATPTLDSIAGLTIDEDAAEQTVSLAGIGAGGGENQPLRVTANSSSPGTFAAATNFVVGVNPTSVSVGDFNGDGNQDLAVANDQSDNVSILLGTGSGTFGAATNFSVGTEPSAVSVGDFDGDGNQDLAVANGADDNVSILLGNGDGTFAAATNFTVGDKPSSMSTGDFDEDGDQDLAVTNQGVAFVNDTVSILLGNGDGTFGAASNFTVGDRPSSISTGDFDADGSQDLAVTNRGAGATPDTSVSILLGNGDGSFAAASNFATGTFDPRDVAVADFDEDGNQDLVVVDAFSTGDRVSILLGNGDGTFGAVTKFSADDQPIVVSVGDFNGDGNQDLATANAGSDNVSILLGSGDGTFGAAANVAVGDRPLSVSVADFNGDGVQDLGVPNADDNNVSILLGEPGIIPDPTVTYTSANSTGSIAFTPVSDQSGTATITVTVEDGGLDNDLDTAADNATFSRSFDVTVNAVNDDPGFDLLFPVTDGHSVVAYTSWPSSEGGNDHWYYLLEAPEDVTWSEARDASAVTGGYLSTTTGDSERELVADLNIDNLDVEVVYLGGFQNTNSPDFSEPEGGWEWITGEAFDYDGWNRAGGEPGNHGAVPENVMIMAGSRWADIAAGDPYIKTYVVEFDRDPTTGLDIQEDGGEQDLRIVDIVAGGGESQTLHVTAVSGNTSLLPDPAVTYTSANTTGSLKFTPVADQSGTATITVTVEDGGLDNDLGTAGDNATFSRFFDVTVNAVNDSPDVTAPADSSVDEDTDLAVSGFTAFDIDVDTALGFARSVPGTILDKDGIGTGFTHRLPGTGSALAEQDANIDVDLATGRMLVTSTRAALQNSMNLENAENPSLLLEGIGTDDFVTSMLVRDVRVPYPSDQISIIVGSSVSETVRAVIHSSNIYVVTRNYGSGDDNWVTGANSFLPGDDLRITLIRSSQKWKMTWTNLTDPARNGESPEFDTPWLDDETDLYVGLHVANPNTDTTFTAKIDEFFVETATAETFSATLSAGDGVVSLAETDGLSFTSGDGSSDASMEFSGTLSRINAAVETVSYRGNQDFNGGDTVSLSIDDGGQHGLGGALSTTASFDVTVNPVNDPPVILLLPDSSLEEDGSIHNDGTILDNFVSDIDSDTTTTEFRIVNFNEISSDFGVTIEMAADSDSFADRSDNTIHVHPADDFNGSTIVTIEARDAQGDVSAQQSFTLTVTAVNDLPVAVVDHFPIDEDEQLTVAAPGILANDSDIEDDSLTAELVADVTNGTLALASDGGFTYIPDAGFHGWEIFTYRATDGSEGGIAVPVIIGVVQHPEIHGSLVHDLDGDGTLDAGEPGLGGWTVFLDTSDDGILDAGEISTTTAVDERGDYSFVDLTPGDYTVAWVTPAGWQATASSRSITLAAGEVRQDVDVTDQFIISATPTVTAVSFADDGSGDTVTIGPNGTDVEVTVNGNVVVRRPATELTSITVNGSGDDDTLIVDLGGLDASLGFAADLTFNGNGDGSDNDTLQLINGSASNIAYSFTNASDGTITIDSGSIEFFGLEPILDSLTTDHREFTFATTDDVVTLSDDGTSDNGLMTLGSVSSSETVTFANPGTSMGIHLGSGADQLTVISLDDGFAGALTLNGEGGDDVIDASAVDVAVKLNGSGGNDTLTGGSAADTLNGGSGSDSLEGGAGNDRLQGQGASYDTLSGGPGDDTLDGGDGYDRISESADVDFTATDSSLTGLGSDTLINIQLVQLFGGSSDNTIDASAFTGRAFLNGSGGNDILTGGGWYDRIFGGSGRDLITGGSSVVDSGTGLPTYDVLRGQGGSYDTLIGGDGADKLNGGAGHDILIGGGGDDVLSGESGDDTLDGGAGIDRLYERGNVDMTLTDASLSGGMGSDDLTSIETAYLKGGNSNNRLNASAFSGDVTLIGVGGADTLRGGSGNDLIFGRAGADLLLGGDGDDTLKGLRDNDTLNGGAGDDWLDGGNHDDAISGYTGDDTLYGRSGDDTLVGGAGHDTLYGADGADITIGDDVDDNTTLTRDDDWIDAGAGQDTVRGGDGTDQMMDDVSEVDESFAFWDEWVDAV